MTDYVFDGPWYDQDYFKPNRLMSLKMDSIELMRHLDMSMGSDCCVYTLSMRTGLSTGAVNNRLVTLVDYGFVLKTKELGNASELGRPLRYYYTLTDAGIYALDYARKLLNP